MALDAEQVDAIADALRTAPTLLDATARWRARYPGVRAMRISAAEMRDEAPVLEFGGRRAYFAATDGLCVSVTQQAGEADMVIFAEDGDGHGDR